MDDYIKEIIGDRYGVSELIGTDAFSDQYRAFDPMMGRSVALKVVRPEFSQNKEIMRRIRRESRALAVLFHPNIAEIYDVELTGETKYIVTEYIDGITLKEYIEQKGVLGWKNALHIITQILHGLRHAHDKGILHRDLRPGNVMIARDGTIKLTGFGADLDHELITSSAGRTAIDDRCYYISPESARGGFVDERSDIYSAGVMLYELLTGQKPFVGKSNIDILTSILSDTVTAPWDIAPSVPKGAGQTALKAMERKPYDRYQTAKDMLKDIDIIMHDNARVFEYSFSTAPQAEPEKIKSFRLFRGKKKTQEKTPARIESDEINTLAKQSYERKLIKTEIEKYTEEAKKYGIELYPDISRDDPEKSLTELLKKLVTGYRSFLDEEKKATKFAKDHIKEQLRSYEIAQKDLEQALELLRERDESIYALRQENERLSEAVRRLMVRGGEVVTFYELGAEDIEALELRLTGQ